VTANRCWMKHLPRKLPPAWPQVNSLPP